MPTESACSRRRFRRRRNRRPRPSPQIAQLLALVVAAHDTQRWVCAALERSEGCSSAERLGHAVEAGSGPKGGQGSRMKLATLGEEADEVGFLGVADEGGDAKGISGEIACGHIRALP